MKIFPPALARLETAFIETIRQYHHNPPKNIGKTTSGNFDDAFLILRAMEDSVLKHLGQPAMPEPEGHFMSAYRLLPQDEKSRLDQIYFNILRERGPMLPPKPPQPF